MVEINLLPEELRKKKKVKTFKAIDLSSVDLSNLSVPNLLNLYKNTPLIRWIILFIASLIALHLILFAIGTYGKVRLYSSTKKYDEILPKKKEADALRAQSESINRKISAINELMVKRFSWARKLNALSDSVAPGVWLNELSYENKVAERIIQSSSRLSANKNKRNSSGSSMEKIVVNYMVLGGYTSQMGDSGTSLVGKFIRSLKNNANFYADFNDIALVSIKSDKVDNQEVMNFKITCPFKENKE